MRTTPVAGKAILVSGHDLRDLHAILEATKDTGINVYTHGEMLPAHGYPELHAYKHLAGNYGGAWQNQQHEFDRVPRPDRDDVQLHGRAAAAYRNRIFTAGPVGWPGLRTSPTATSAPVVQAARALPGFGTTEPEQTITVGFGREAVLGAAGQVSMR